MKKIVTYIPLVILLAWGAYYFLGNQSIQTISTIELAEKLEQEANSKNVVFIDVREPSEYEEGHIKGMINVPLSTLSTNTEMLPKDSQIVIICRSGNRSMQAAKILEELGYNNIVNVDGGIMSWDGELVF
ncbi:rhodanese-like domain-containing protein [Bacillus sp. 31A1R]|uniref:Rhodanese-like domain-containing protein n=1 Tax=Robertmurraya mangrovi TaxID=3098077 RepID=A0ABU5IYR3_9BACI|nr:rhodanese-like domain-containing protein [Bacillus sp. 31A1R]MDZ5472277.1 rhodanese-like domain-containing protein [Bacillus sp. 31A1R]